MLDHDEEASTTLHEVWSTKHRPTSDYKHGRDGDNLMVPFECDLCLFRKLRNGETPIPEAPQDLILLNAIRRINLDAFWSRASSTVRANKDRISSGLTLSRSMGLEGPYVFYPQPTSFDVTGYEVALQMVMHSCKPGKYSANYTQWDTIRKFRSSYATFARTTPQGCKEVLALADDKGQIERFVQDGTASYWFSRFFIGCKRRMGQDWRPNHAFSIELLEEIFCKIEERIEESDNAIERLKWITFAAYCAVTYTLSLRGSEGFLLDLAGLHKHWGTGYPRYFIVALLGRVKGETSDRAHLLPCVVTTSSGLKVFELVQRLVRLKESQGFIYGPAISNTEGKIYTSAKMDTCLIDILEETF